MTSTPGDAAVLSGSMLLSYVVGNLHGLDADEMSGGDRGLLRLCTWAGVALVGADLLRSVESVRRLLRFTVALAAVISLIGMVQFFTGVDLAGLIRPPGLAVNSYADAIQNGAVRRVAGTATHPIEFGMVLAMVVPFALHFAQ